MNDIIKLESGNLRRNVNLSIRTWFVYVTATGHEAGVTTAASHGGGFRKVRSSQNSGFNEGGTLRQTVEMEVTKPGTLKMISNLSSFGKGNMFANIYIDVNPDYEMIKFTGFEEFGSFSGRARIDYKKSFYNSRAEGTDPRQITKEIMKTFFGLKLIQPPKRKSGGGRRVRSLIY